MLTAIPHNMSTNTSADTLFSLTGKVKWFNNKAGFGFITACDGEQSGKDFFVHYSSLQVKTTDQYKYLVQGEYVNFSLVKPDSGDHQFHAVNVCGIKGGSLMCETRKQSIVERAVRTANPAISESTRDEVTADIRRKTRARKTTAAATTTPAKTPSTTVSTTEAAPSVPASADGFQKVSRKRNTKPKGKTAGNSVSAAKTA